MLIKTSKTQHHLGRTRSQQCENLRKVYGGSGGLSDEDLDKIKYLEKKNDIRDRFLPGSIISKEVPDEPTSE